MFDIIVRVGLLFDKKFSCFLTKIYSIYTYLFSTPSCSHYLYFFCACVETWAVDSSYQCAITRTTYFLPAPTLRKLPTAPQRRKNFGRWCSKRKKPVDWPFTVTLSWVTGKSETKRPGALKSPGRSDSREEEGRSRSNLNPLKATHGSVHRLTNVEWHRRGSIRAKVCSSARRQALVFLNWQGLPGGKWRSAVRKTRRQCSRRFEMWQFSCLLLVYCIQYLLPSFLFEKIWRKL